MTRSDSIAAARTDENDTYSPEVSAQGARTGRNPADPGPADPGRPAPADPGRTDFGRSDPGRSDSGSADPERLERNRSLISAAQAGDDAAMERLVIENTGLVRTVAVRFRDRGTEFEDLMQIGTLGMIKAIRSFDTTRGTAFSTYAVPLIVGEIRRHLRDDGLIRVGRGCRHLAVRLMRERSRIALEEGRDAGIVELAALCGVPAEEAALALDSLAPVTSLSDSAFGEDSPELGAVIPDQAEADDMARRIDRLALEQVIASLPPMWRQIVTLRYFRDMTQQQVADLLGLSQVKVSREEKKIMAFMRGQLEG